MTERHADLSGLEALSKAEIIDLVHVLVGRFDAQIAALEQRVADLEDENAALRRDLERDSTNSGLPPSSDTKASRQKRDKAAQKSKASRRGRPGKQPGAAGKTLARSDDPDHIEVHAPSSCDGCGQDLGDADITDTRSRQVFDLPPRQGPEVTDHRVQTRRCHCGAETTAQFPPEAQAPACWGPNVRAVAVYLVVAHHVPYRRVGEILAEVFGIDVSAATITNWVADVATRLAVFEATLKVLLATAGVIHLDETGCRVNRGSDTHYVHVVSTALLTLLVVHKNRGRQAITDIGILPSFDGVAVHDRYARYFDYDDVAHALCIAHLQRNLASVAETATQQHWAQAMADLLAEAHHACCEARDRDGPAAIVDPALVHSIKTRYGRIVAAALRANPDPPSGRKRNVLERESYNLARAFDRLRGPILRFVDDLDVPYTNNQAERDCRPVKLHQKISGLWRSHAQAANWVRIRSYISTLRKNQEPVLAAIHTTISGNPWLPTTAW